MTEDENKIYDFLYQSNMIEGVLDDESLDNAKFAWDLALDRDIMTPQTVKDIHSQLMLGQPIEPKYIGEFRDCPVYVGRKEKLPHSLVPTMVGEWCNRMNEHDKEYDEEELHILFENIHPFVDGNGRLGRIFFNWLRVKRGEEIKVFWNDEKQEYYSWFK